MANDEKQPRANLTSNGVILAVLVAASTYFVVHQAPLQGERPAVTEPQLHEKVGKQDIEARLWQDPFTAVARSVGKPDPSKVEQPCDQKPDDSHCRSPLAAVDEETLKNTLVIGVTVSGAPYSENIEFRRRLRYAVLAGLDRAGFVPKDPQHIGYFRPKQNDGLPLPIIVPFEWFQKPKTDLTQSLSILVSWVNEDALDDKPLEELSWLVSNLRKQGVPSSLNAATANVAMRILGPETSDMLLKMAEEVKTAEVAAIEQPKKVSEASKKHDNWSSLAGVIFYTYGATVDCTELFRKLYMTQGCVPTVHAYFEKHGITLFRTVATDDVLALELVGELKRRGVKPRNGKDHIALISEWDTAYGQRFPTTMENCFADPEHSDCWRNGESSKYPWVHELRYLRGLDGVLPTVEVSGDQKTVKVAEPAEEQAGVKDANKTQTDAKASDRPFGDGQQDYLRRIAEQLRKIDEDLRRDDRGSIKAIGVLGSDVFDKLLVLRALRPYFPDALFFTTDFDETLMMPSELSWTRNLIVASSFGPELTPEIQGDIPPFRGSYQTAAFLATRLAIGDPSQWKSPVDQEQIQKQQEQILACLSRARVFEIERTGEFLAFPRLPRDKGQSQNSCGDLVFLLKKWGETSSPPSPKGSDPQQYVCGNEAASNNDIQPPDEKIFPHFELKCKAIMGFTLAVPKVAVAFAVAALLVLLTLGLPWARKSAMGRVMFLGVVLFGIAFACLFWEHLAGWLTSDGTGEPIAWVQGVSIWPTVLLRIMSIVLSCFLIWRACQKLRTNLDDIVHRLKLPAVTTRPRLLMRLRLPRKMKRMFSYFSYRLGKSKSEGPLDTLEPYDIARAWSDYVHQDQLCPRLWRVAGYVTAMFALFFVLILIFGSPVTPARGELASGVWIWVTFIDVVLAQFLIFFVFDATLFCLLFVNELRRGLTQWPIETKEKFEGRLGLKHELIAEWINLDFVARRTKCLSNLIYYPFVVIALLIVSRSTVFANYAPSPPILITLGISLTIAVGCAVWLRWAAEAARDTAKWKLMAGIVRAKGLEDGGRTAGQLEALLSRVDGLHEGVFSPFSQQPVVIN